jgi:hypothetical protein
VAVRIWWDVDTVTDAKKERGERKG